VHSSLFFFNDPATTEIYTLSLHDALPIWDWHNGNGLDKATPHLASFDHAVPSLLTDLDERGLLDTTLVLAFGEMGRTPKADMKRSEEHTSELQSQSNLVCRLLLEKKKQKI